MISLAIQQFRARWQRSLAVFIAVVLGVAFFTIALLAGGPLNQNLRVGVGQQIHGADLVVTSKSGDEASQTQLETVLGIDGVAAADLASFTPTQIQASGTQTYLLIADTPSVPAVRDNIELKSGNWPENSGEIVIAENNMDELSLTIGDEVTLYDGSTEESTAYTVVGVSESPSGLAQGRARAFLSQSDYAELSSDPYTFAIRIQLNDGVPEDAALQTIQDQLGADFEVWTFNDYVDAEVESLAGGTVALQILLGGFAAIAMVASGIVIANSFEISLAQRVREIGLLRSVGASNRQVRRLVVAEALLVGVIASVLGVGLGIALMAIIGQLLWADGAGSTGLEISPLTMGVPFVLGVIATLLSAFGPARGAMRVHPLQAIRQSEAPAVTATASRKRMIFAALLGGVGAIVMTVAVVTAVNGGAENGMPLLLGIFGGALTFFAVLMSAQVILPRVTRVLGTFASKTFGVTGDLALGNLTRNPRRTASAAAALLMGVTLMTMMTVGASSVRSTIVGEVQDREPIDLQVRLDSEDQAAANMSQEVVRWETIDGVAELASVQLHELQLDGDQSLTVLGIDPAEANAILRSDGLHVLADDTIVVNEDTASSYGLAEGDLINLANADSSVTLEVHVGGTGVSEPVITLETMRALAGDGEASGVWIRLADGATVGSVMDEVRSGLPPSMQLSVSGGAAERESTLDVLDTMLLVVLGLLAASVVIAVVGIGNTLTLSVIERTRESGMLRAMGLKRGQVRRMLALEGVVISLVGTVTGILLGVVYGFAGVLTLFGDALDLTYSVPWTQLALICLVAVASGLLASILPARRALAIKPVEALSDIG